MGHRVAGGGGWVGLKALGLGVLIQGRPWTTPKHDFPLYLCFSCKDIDTSMRKEPRGER